MTTSCSLLIIEDDAEFRAIVERRFERRGFQIVACDCLDGALNAAQQNRFDAVLMDRTLAGRDSLCLVPQLKELHPEIQVVVLSGRDDRSSIDEALAAGASEYLTKPCSLSDMELAIQRACSAVAK